MREDVTRKWRVSGEMARCLQVDDVLVLYPRATIPFVSGWSLMCGKEEEGILRT
jgi:hypothetical protein